MKYEDHLNDIGQVSLHVTKLNIASGNKTRFCHWQIIALFLCYAYCVPLTSIAVFRRGQIRNKDWQFVSSTVGKVFWHRQPDCPWTGQQRWFLCETPSNMFSCETFQRCVYFVPSVYRRRYKQKVNFSTLQCLACIKTCVTMANFLDILYKSVWLNVLNSIQLIHCASLYRLWTFAKISMCKQQVYIVYSEMWWLRPLWG